MLDALRTAIALLLVGGTYWECLLHARRLLGRPLPLVAPVALAGLVVWETVLFNVLSLFHGISSFSVAAAHALVLVLLGRAHAGVLHAKTLRSLRVRLLSLPSQWLSLLPLLLMLSIVTVVYAPNNWDSMTYHLGRVAHWIQNGSIEYFPTSIERQNELTPGAELVLLALQSIAGNDRLANLLQFGAYFLCVGCMPSLARILGVPRKLSHWAAMFVASLPMAALQACTTQNDLVAACMTMAMVISALGLVKSQRIPHFVAFGVAAAAALIVKPTAVLAATPLALALILPSMLRARGHAGRALRWVSGISVIALIVLLVVAPDVWRKAVNTGSPLAHRFEVYPLFGEWRDRFLNSFRAVCQNSIAPTPWKGLVRSIAGVLQVPTGEMHCRSVFVSNEDYAGNPLHAAASMIMLGWTVVTLPYQRRRNLTLAASAVAAWLLLHAFVRNQEFITRLQLPVLVLSPLFWPGFLAVRFPIRRLRTWLVIGISFVCVTCAYTYVTFNSHRPFHLAMLPRYQRSVFYYMVRPSEQPLHERALKALKANRCQKLGLHIKRDDYDYPLTWRAMLDGAEVRHYLAPSRWPCLVFSTKGQPPAGPGWHWSKSDGDEHLFVQQRGIAPAPQGNE